MRGLSLAISALFVAGLASTRPAHASVELKNDGFASGLSAGFQAGFVIGEIGASRFVAPEGRRLLAVRLLFGGAPATKTVTLHVWDDSAGTTAPGAMIFESDFDLAGSNDSLHELDLSTESVFVPAQFRVGIEFQHAGLPSIARDDDGSVSAGKNFIFAIPGGWIRSVDGLVTGDWIIRAIVSDGAGSPDAGVTPDAGNGAPDAGNGGPDAGNGGACTGNGDCTIGEYCDPDTRACTFDCRDDTDCPDNGQCNSLGQCIGASSDGGGGCCSTGGGDGVVGALGLAGVVGLMVTRRRRGSTVATGSRPS